jgi:calcineurin-like phosphoesterase family protein
MDYLWSDLHLFHKNVILYEDRPFASVEDMNATIIKNWRDTISNHDKLFNFGDVALGCSKEMLEKIIKSLPGYKVLIMGNHDRGHSVKWFREVGFDEVYPYPIIVEGFYIFSHEDVYVNDHMPYVNIHGHSHSKGTDNPQKVNVSVEKIGYKPVSFESIKKRFNTEEYTNEKC